ncbi:MAG: hypothetical protein HYS32_03070 [Candidatus Woesearchaeota archaeon]|nr:MAG: hypothetical protein HYS32_03070 [Candidatus Woesearchaeota archaeon]
MGEESTILLGKNMELSGFKYLDDSTRIIVRKIVGNHVKKMSNVVGDFEKLSLNLKDIHKTENAQKYQINGKLEINGKLYNSEVTDFNLFFALSSVLDKLFEEAKR